MSQLEDLWINLAGAGIAFALGAVTRTVVHYLRVRRGRRFWGAPTSGEEVVVFLGAMPTRPDFVSYEPSGLIGMGDMHAVQELTTVLNDLDIRSTMAFIRHSHDQQRKNVILVGAEGVNAISHRLKDRYERNYEFDLDRGVLKDKAKGITYKPVWDDDLKEIRYDYGTLIRAENPYMGGRTIVAFGGVYGYGTWGGVRAVTHPEFRRRERSLGSPNVECLFRVEVLNGGILTVDILDVAPLSPRNSSSLLPSETSQRSSADDMDSTAE